MFTIPNDFYVTFISNVSDPLYDDLNKTSGFRTKLSPTIKFNEEKYKVALVDCILKNAYNILRKDRTYEIKVRPHDWPLLSEKWIISINSGEYPFIKLAYKEYGSMTELCRAITRRIYAHKNGAFNFYYLMKHAKIYISSPLDDEKVIINNNLRDVLCFKQNIINGRSTGSISGMERVIFADYRSGFSLDNCIFLYASFVETSRVGNSNVPLLRILERKTPHEHIDHYNLKRL